MQGDDLKEETEEIKISFSDHSLHHAPPQKRIEFIGSDKTFGDLKAHVTKKLKKSEGSVGFFVGKEEVPDEKPVKDWKSLNGFLILKSLETNSGPASEKYGPPALLAPTNQIVPYIGPSMAGASPSYTPAVNSWDQKSSTGYVGLSNQGATCYMNSLIQTLFMTPEFRLALYKWNFEETLKKWEESEALKRAESDKMEIDGNSKEEWEKSSIPRQLQLLFARLQLRDRKAVKTKALTSSFGWNESEAFTQHDVQELCRVLFDALEKVLQGTEQENLINELYQGEMEDYVKCKSCGSESIRKDKYLDIPLVIRSFGSTVPVGSVEEALEKFVEPEVLEGDNQYHCEKCDAKVDALKGLKFTSFPYLLTLQLKRFDFDYEMFRRIKLNDRVTFPFLLDLNHLVGNKANTDPSSSSMKKRKLEEAVKGVKRLSVEEDLMDEDVETTVEKFEREAGKEEDDELTQGDEKELSPEEQSRQWEETVADALKKGPYVYELYSVLIHRGSAIGGHYYAYIKSFETKEWFQFNDSQVTSISPEEVKKTFGDEPTDRPKSSYSSYFQSSANAYMLMYRRIDPSNKTSVPISEIPGELKTKIEEENHKHIRKAEEKEREKELITMKVFSTTEGPKEVKIHNQKTWREATLLCAEAVGIASKYPPDCIRLRDYQEYRSLPLKPIDPENVDRPLKESSRSIRSVFVETKEPGSEFPEYNELEMMLRIILFNEELNKFDDMKPLYIMRNATLGELKEAIQKKFNIPTEKQRLFREVYTYRGDPPKELEGDENTLKTLNISESSKVYAEASDDLEGESKCSQEIQRIQNLIELKYQLPDSETLHSIQVSKKITLLELRELLQPLVKLPIDEFKISRGSTQWKQELKGDGENLEDCRLMDGMKLIIEKGRRTKDGEVQLEFFLFDPQRKLIKDYFELFFELRLSEDMPYSELKELLSKCLKEEKQMEVPPSRIRVRDIASKSPSSIFRDLPLKENKCSTYGLKTLAIQILEDEEEYHSEKQLSIFVRQWFPSKFELGPFIEIIFPRDMSVEAVKQLLSERFGIEDVGLGKPTEYFWPGGDLIDVKNVDWDKRPFDTSNPATLISPPFYLGDGDILYFRDNKEELKELTEEEEKALKKAAQSKKQSTYKYAREEALKIKV